MGTNEQIARLILQQTWEEREMLADELNVDASKIGQWAKSMEAPEPAAQDDDGYIRWKGGYLPVADSCIVSVKFKNGENDQRRSSSLLWKHYDSDYDIVAYKVIKP